MSNICNDILITVKTTYDCVRICSETPSAPTANYDISEYNLISTSEFNTNTGYYKWLIYDGNYLLYDSGWGEKDMLILDFSNGSTFDNIYLGINNIDIITLLYSLGFYIKNRTLSISHLVMDENNKKSEKITKYFFNETD